MAAIPDIVTRLKDLESILGHSVVLTEKPAEEEAQSLPEDEQPKVVQTKEESSSLSMETTVDCTTAQSNPALEDLDSQDEMSSYRDAAPFAHLKAQDLSDEDVPFCPWKVVCTYADCYTGKANRPRVRIYFDDALNYRDWSFFYIRDTHDPKKAHLLVPTRQVQNFLSFINKRVGTELRVPSGPPGRVFYLCFRGCGPFRPRYLLHHERSSPSDAIAAATTSSGFDLADPHTWPKHDDENAGKDARAALQTDAESRLRVNMALLRRDPSERAKMTAGQRFEKRQARRKKDLQAMLGYLGLRNGVVERASDVVFVCVDVELIELAPKPISEIGVALLDMQRVGEQSAGSRGKDWWPSMEAHHLRVKEYSGLTNYRYVQGCPDDFQFGESTFPPMSEVCEALRAILKPFVEENRRIVLVGHDINQDVNYLARIRFDLQHETHHIGIVDSQVLHQVWSQTDSSRSLATVLNELQFEYSYLHNAGNDAVHTLRAAIGAAFAATETGETPSSPA